MSETEADINVIRAGDYVMIKPDADFSGWQWHTEKRRWQDGQYVGVVESIGMDYDRLKVGFHDGGIEFSYFFERDELELADIDMLAIELVLTTREEMDMRVYEYSEAAQVERIASAEHDRRELEQLKRVKVALQTIASYSDDPMTWDEIVTGLENEANRLQTLHLLTADVPKAKQP